jgi:hypothetical protein
MRRLAARSANQQFRHVSQHSCCFASSPSCLISVQQPMELLLCDLAVAVCINTLLHPFHHRIHDLREHSSLLLPRLFRVRAKNRHQLDVCKVVIVVIIQMIEELVCVSGVVFVAHIHDPLPNNFDLRAWKEQPIGRR